MTRARTRDLGTGASEPVYTVSQLGPNRRLLPNGNLLCLNVPIARSGWLVYGPGEVPVKPGARGVAYVERTNDALFDDKAMRSFVGAAVTDDHPPEDVTPDNFERFAGGYVLSVRRGTGDDADVLLGDLVITKRSTIDAILGGKVEVSAGYDADYVDKGDGVGLQLNLTGNHVALVARGRCGPRCAIGDSAFPLTQPATATHGENMTTRVNTRGASRRATLDDGALALLRQRAQDAVADLSAAEGGADEGDDQGGAVHVHIHGGEPAGAGGSSAPARTTDARTEDRMAALETGLADLTQLVADGFAALGKKTKDEAAAAAKGPGDEGEGEGSETDAQRAEGRDSAALHSSYTQMMAQAEILVPGFKVPTFDAAAKRATTVDRMCTSRKLCLSQFAATRDGGTMLKALAGGKDADIVSMDCAEAATLFAQAAGAKAALNNAASTSGAHRTGDAAPGAGNQAPKKALTNADINEINRKFWEGK